MMEGVWDALRVVKAWGISKGATGAAIVDQAVEEGYRAHPEDGFFGVIVKTPAFEGFDLNTYFLSILLELHFKSSTIWDGIVDQAYTITKESLNDTLNIHDDLHAFDRAIGEGIRDVVSSSIRLQYLPVLSISDEVQEEPLVLPSGESTVGILKEIIARRDVHQREAFGDGISVLQIIN